MRSSLKTASLMLALGVLTACGADDESNDYSREMGAARASYLEIVHASYEDSLELARALDGAIESLLAEPSQDGLEGARDAWLRSREPYLQTEVYRFYDGPIDNVEDGPEGLINAWPMDEAYIDYVDDAGTILNEGIVNDPEVAIDGPTLEDLNEGGGEKNIATGYHAIEFLLWGQDQSDDGPGARPYTDYVVGDGATHENQERRGQYLETVSGLLVGHLEDMVDAWTEGDESNYRNEFETVAEKEAFARILTGMVTLSGFETGGERLRTALISGEQEDEHSCFSDNTHRDMVQDIQGVKNVWVGSYERLNGDEVSGPGVESVVRAKDPGLASELDARIDESLRLAGALEPPFDQEIKVGNDAGNARVQELVDSLFEQRDLLEEVFRSFELDVPDPEAEQ